MESRRSFLKKSAAITGGVSLMGLGGTTLSSCNSKSSLFKISIAEWSLNKSIFGKSRELSWEDWGKLLEDDPDALLQGDIDHLDFAKIARRDFGIDAVESGARLINGTHIFVYADGIDNDGDGKIDENIDEGIDEASEDNRYKVNEFGAYIFDGQQAPMNAMLGKIDSVEWSNFITANSINISRLIPQMFYYYISYNIF